MDDLPDKILVRILNLVPIKQVIRCSIVSKRWDAACRFIIRTRQSLIIKYDDEYRYPWSKQGWDRERGSGRLDVITLAYANESRNH